MRPHILGLQLTAAALLALTLTGCDLPGLPTDDDTAAAPAEARPPGDSWVVVQQGKRPAPEPPAPAAPPVEKHPEVLHLPKAAHIEAPHPVDPRCLGSHTPGTIAPATADPGATTAAVSWYHPGDASVVTYRLTAIPQRLRGGVQPQLAWQEVEPGHGCRTITATVTGLERDAPYVFSVDAVRTVTWSDAARAATVARTRVVSTD